MLGCGLNLLLVLVSLGHEMGGGFLWGALLSMMFIVALYLPWCRYLSAQFQLYADIILSVYLGNPDLLLNVARFTTGYIRLVGQELALSKCVLLSTSREVRKDMRDWVLSQEGDKWSVKYDVRDLGGHLDTTFRGWSSTLAARVRLVISRLVLVFVLPPDFHGRVRVVRSMYLPAALHGVQASLMALDSLRKLRSSICTVVWSRRQPLASVGAVLSFLDGPTGCAPAFCVVCFRFRLFRRYLASGLSQVRRAYRFLEMVGEGCPGHGPIHLLSASAAEIGFRWDPFCPCLAIWLALFNILRLLFLMPGGTRLKLIFVVGKVFGAGLCGMCMALCSSLTLLMSGTENKALLRSVMVGGVWNVFLLGRVRGKPVPCRFCGAPGGDGHLFWECTSPPLVEIRENPEFRDLMREDKAHWPRCLLWHGWLPVLSGINGASPWAADASESAFYLVETALDRYSSGRVSKWSLPDGFDADEVSARMPDAAKVWSDGSLVLASVTGVSAAGAGMFAHQSELCWSVAGGVMLIAFSPIMWLILVGFLSVPGPLQTVQRAELWGSFLLFSLLMLFMWELTILVLFGVLGACWMIVFLLLLFELVADGDLLVLIRRMLDLRGRDTVRVTKVKGHADEGMVFDGRVRELDKFGNDAADEAADFGRRRVGPAVIDARRNLSGVCGRWNLVLLDLHRFFIAISRAVVNDGIDGTAPDPMVWSAGALPKRRRIVHAARYLVCWSFGYYWC